MKTRHFFLLGLVAIYGCGPGNTSKTFNATSVSYTSDQFSDYWYSGKAEVATYKLQQSRYGEIREGTTAMIFVTEPFSRKKQVKLDYPEDAASDKQTVIKMNFTRKFVTGIYPYSMMLSVFTPVNVYDYPETVKVTMSSQEWCGQVFTQFNLEGNKYRQRSFSYFESEGDIDRTIGTSILEDEIWNRIRLNPESLPVGEIEIIPSSFFARLNHEDYGIKKANTVLTKTDSVSTYIIEYLDINRSLSITFDATFPFKIRNWVEITGEPGAEQKTTGVYMTDLHIDYWDKNESEFEYLRDSLMLTH